MSTSPRTSRTGRHAASTDEPTATAKPTRKRGPSAAAAGPILPPPPRAGGASGGTRGRGSGGGSGAPYVRDRSVDGGGGDGKGGSSHGVRSGGGQGEQGRGRGMSVASVGSVDGELRGGELERVRGRVADLGAAIETSQVRGTGTGRVCFPPPDPVWWRFWGYYVVLSWRCLPL